METIDELRCAVFVNAEVVRTANGILVCPEAELLPKNHPWYASRKPPAPGWYNASIHGSPHSFRYWDGSVWSMDVLHPKWDLPYKWLEAKERKTYPNIKWRNVRPYRNGEEWDFLRD